MSPLSRQSHVVVVDDEPEMADLLREVISEAGYRATAFSDPVEALDSILEAPPDLIITDLRMGEMDGMSLLEQSRAAHPDVPVILATAFGSIDVAVEATRKGAYHFVTKPFRMKEVLLLVERALTHGRTESENRRLRREVEKRYRFSGIIGKSNAMQTVFSLIERVARSTSNVLVLGESGTGKELVARAIHYNSPRKSQPFVAVNCSALPEGLLESELFGHVRGAFTGAHATRAGLFQEASDGTLFLDEIGDMPLALQAKLLRTLQEKTVRPVGGNRETRVSTRVVAATHRDLKVEVREGRFREDLYYRLAVIPIRLPPLRERVEDIPLLVEHFLTKVGNDMGLGRRTVTPEAMKRLIRHSWTGNVRELENMVERACVLTPGESIDESAIAEELDGGSASTSLPAFEDLPTLRELERQYIAHVLRVVNGSKEEAAAVLGIDRRTLYRWRKRHDLDPIRARIRED